LIQTPIGGPPPATTPYRFTSDAERGRRLELLRSAMHDQQLDALVVAGRDDIRYRGRSFYVSDVWQLVADTHVVILPEGAPIFIGGQVFGIEQADVVEWATTRLLNGNAGQEIANVLRTNAITSGRVGIVGLSDAAFSAWHLNVLLADLPDVTAVDATELFEAARQVNSAENLGYFADTAEVLKRIYADIEPKIRPGMTEIELAALAHSTARLHGLRDPMVLMQTTPFGALGFGTTKVIEPEDIVCLWIESAGPSGFWVEYRRCYTFGAPTAAASDFWKLQVEATNAGLERLVPGALASEFVAASEAVLKKAGFDYGYTDFGDSHYMYSLHGIGTDAIQGVWVPGKDRVLKEDEVVNIHPTIDFKTHSDLAKYGWLGVTDNAVVTPQGGALQTHTPDFPDGFIAL
jgi:Xaa-Pro aminopeptidase